MLYQLERSSEDVFINLYIKQKTDLQKNNSLGCWDGDGQGSLACFCLWDHKESDTTEGLNWTE